MSTSRFTGQKLDDDLVASISGLLDAANVPNVLWGNYLLTVVAFAVPDALIDIAYSTLSQADFLPCTRNLDCRHSNTQQRPPPTAHLHIDDELVILLYRKFDALWEYPDFKLPLQDENSHIMSASDTRLPAARLGRGRGRLSPDLGFVRIPSATKFCEAVILSLCRDYDTTRRVYWMAILTYILEFVDETDIFDEHSLGNEYMPFYHALKHGDSRMYVSTFGRTPPGFDKQAAAPITLIIIYKPRQVSSPWK